MKKLKLLQQKINYNKIVTGSDLQPAIVKSNFELYDKLMSDPKYYDEETHKQFLSNDSIYSYAFFNDDFGKPFRYTAYQDAISNLHHDFTHDNPNRFIIFLASNQVGKSRLLCGKAAKIVNTESNVNIVMVSKSLPQSQFLLAQIKHTFNNSKMATKWREDLGDTANTTVLTFEFKRGNQIIVNRIICAPAGEGLLGYPVHYLFLDEVDFYEKGQRFFWKVAYPRTNKTKGQIICFSNPNPDISRSGSILWELWQGDLFKRKFQFNFLDADWNTKEEFEIAKRNSPSHIFASTHMGQFSDEGGAFLSYNEIKDMMQRDWSNEGLPAVDRPVYIALDLGKMNDNTVLGIGITHKPKNNDDKYQDLDVKYMEEFPLKTDYSTILERIREIQQYYEDNYYGVAGTGYDSTGQKTFGDFLTKAGISAQGVDFSAKLSNKTQLYNDFKLMAENRKIKIVYHKKCETQLSNLVFKLTETKKLKVENSSDTVHDDFPDFLVILVHISVTPGKITPGITVLGDNDLYDEDDFIEDDENSLFLG